NSIAYENNGKQHYNGYVDEPQLKWLKQVLAKSRAKDGGSEQIFVMVHHNVLEHLPNQATSKLGRRYMLENAPALIEILQDAGVQLVFTGHLHVQDIAYHQHANLFDVTTGSLVSYPHPYRICRYRENEQGQAQLMIESHRVPSAPGWPDLQSMSREFVQEHSLRFIRRLLTEPPLNLSDDEIDPLLPHLRHFWTNVADGDAQFDFPHLPAPVQAFFQAFSAQRQWDNQAILDLHSYPNR
ncbi:metallophosphoesterase, partial [Okeania sp. SIO2G5]|uniref:metallophosphoesterase family protein n=1 Tax=Okeania sp. SIO2G5 TaxID=2607796 RepID=UPI0013BF4FAD